MKNKTLKILSNTTMATVIAIKIIMRRFIQQQKKNKFIQTEMRATI